MDAETEAPATSSDAPPRPSRLRRVVRIVARAALALVVLVALALSALLFALGHLDHPLLKPHVRGALRDALALDVDFRRLSFSLAHGRLHAAGLTVAQPPRFAGRAAPFVVVREGDVDLDLEALLGGAIRIRSSELRGLEVTYVADETTDSVTLLFPDDPNVPLPPLSRSLDSLRDLGIDISDMRAPDAALVYVELEQGAEVRRARLSELALRAHLHERSGVLDAGLGMRPAASSRTARLTLAQAPRAASADGSIEARARVDADARLSLDGAISVRDALSVRLAARVESSRGLPIEARAPLDLGLDLGVRFDPRAGSTHVDLRSLSLFGEVFRARLAGDVDDATPDTLRDADGTLDLAFEESPLAIEGADLHGVQVHLGLDHARLSPRGIDGGVDLRATADRAALEASGARLRARSLRLAVRGHGLSLTPESLARSEVRAVGPIDVVEFGAAELDLEEGTELEVALVAPTMRAEGIALVGSLAENAPVDARVSFAAERFAGRSGNDRIEAAPLATEASLDDFVRQGTGLFGLGGRAELRLTTSGSARTGGQTARFTGLSPTVRADFDRHRLEGDLPIGSLDVREGGERTLALRGADLRFDTQDPTTLAPPTANGRLVLSGRVAHADTGSAAMGIPSLELTVDGRAGAYRLGGRATLRDLETSGERFEGMHQLAVEGSADLRHQVVDLDAHLAPAGGREGPSFDATVHAAIDPETAVLENQVELEAHRLAPALARYLPEGATLDLTSFRVQGEGRWSDLFARRPARGTVPELAADYVTRMQGDEHLALVVEGVEAAKGTSRVSIPRLSLALGLSQRDGALLAELGAEADSTTLRDGADEFVLHAFRPRIDVRLPDVERLDVASVEADVRVGRIDQALLPGYPLTDLQLTASVEAAPGEITLRDLRLANPGGHSTFRMTGAYEHDGGRAMRPEDTADLESIRGREALTFTGEFTQELGPLAGTSFARSADGHLRIGFEVQSGDLRTYRGVARFVADGVDFTSPDGALVVEDLDGEIPVEETVTFLSTGPVLDPGAGINALSRARFPDVQPFLNTDAYLTSQRLQWQGQSLGPLAGNVRVAGTTLSIDRLQVGYRGGSLTGQLEADLMPGASHLSFRGNATGIHTEHGGDEVLDANVALRFVPESLTLDGTMQLVRVGRSHLLELLDAVDPYHEDADMNTVRSLLRLGYPRFARLRAAEGLMDFEVSLGGLASAVRIDPIRAIPIAPLLEEYAAPMVETFFPRSREHVASGASSPASATPREDEHE